MTTPQIRFEGFDGEWGKVTLGEIAKRQTKKNTDLEVSETFTNSAEFGVITQLDFFDHSVSNKESISGYYVVGPDDFIYNPRISKFAPFGPINRNKIERTGVVSPLYSVFSVKNLEHTFLEWFFKGRKWHEYMRKNGDTGARHDRLAISADEFFEMDLSVPTSAEQGVVGLYFQDLEALIKSEENKLKNLRNLKQSMLVKMFPQAGSSVPEIRFEGFDGEWDSHQLGEIGTTFGGLTGKCKDDFGHGEARYITYMNVFSNMISNPLMVDHVEIDPAQHQVAVGDVLFTTSSETPEEVGMSSVVTELNGITYLNSFCFGYRPKEQFDLYFLASLLRSAAVRSEFQMLAQGISRFNISKKKAMEISVPVPSSAEQEAIGNYFSKLDNLIRLEEGKLNKLKNLKNSFLNKMFV